LETVRAYDFGYIVGITNTYVRASAYLDLKQGREAADEFQVILDRRGVDSFDPGRPLSYLGLARAASMAGDTSRSRKAYQDFLALWKDADQDLPVLIEARKEYESLSQ
jgi:predicted Zn-dependent protease